jgi:hypothetical protein
MFEVNPVGPVMMFWSVWVRWEVSNNIPSLNTPQHEKPHRSNWSGKSTFGQFLLRRALKMFVQCGAKHSPSHIHFKSTKGGKGTLQHKSVLLGTFKELGKSFCLLFSERFLLILEQTESLRTKGNKVITQGPLCFLLLFLPWWHEVTG